MQLKWLTALLVLVARCSCGVTSVPQPLDSSLEYRYNFEGRVGVNLGQIGGLSEEGAGEQVAGAAIRGSIKVQRTGESVVGLQLSALEVGSHHGPVEFGGRAPLPVQYRPLQPSLMKQLGKTFFLHQEDINEPKLEVPADDLLWMINFRKGLMSNIHGFLMPLMSSIEGDPGADLIIRRARSRTPLQFSLRQNTLFGLCDNRYSMVAITEDELQKVRSGDRLREDLQSRRHQGKKLPSGLRVQPFHEDMLTLVTRVIDHTTCYDTPVLLRAVMGNVSIDGRPTGEHMQRHSTLQYYLRGGPFGLYRIEHIRAEGFLSYNPFGYTTDQLQTVTNQSFVLAAVTIKTELPRGGPTQTLNMKHSVMSPYSKPTTGEVKDWVHYQRDAPGQPGSLPVYWEASLLGENLSSTDLHKYKDELIRLLVSSVARLQTPATEVPSGRGRSKGQVGGSSSGLAAAELHSAQRIAAALPSSALQEVWEVTRGVQRDVFIDVLAASSSGPAASLLLRHMTPQSAGSAAAAEMMALKRQTSVLLTMSTNAPDPSIVAPLVEYIKSLDLKEEPVMGPIVYLSAARLLRSLCAANTSAVPMPLYGDRQCNQEYVGRNFGEYLLNRIKNSEPAHWAERAALVHTYASLGIKLDLSALQLLARSDSNLIVQTTAVYGLSARNLGWEHRKHATWILWSLFQDEGLLDEVRQSALAAFVSWKPDLYQWNRLGLTTWWRSTTSTARYAASTLEAAARRSNLDEEQREFAAAALRLSRPIATPDNTSRHVLWDSEDDHYQTALHVQSSWLSHPPSWRASQRYMAAGARVGADEIDLVQLAVGFNQYPGVGPVSPGMPAYRPPRAPASLRSQQRPGDTDGPQMKLLLKLLNTELFLPIDFQEFEVNHGSKTPLQDLLWYNFGPCGSGAGGNILAFTQPGAIEAFVPNEMGLPVLGELVNPIVLYSNISMSGSSCRDPYTGSFHLTTDTKLSSKMTSVLKVMVPWLGTSIAAGVDLEKSVTLPMKVEGGFAIPWRDITEDDAASGGAGQDRAGEERDPWYDPLVSILLDLNMTSTRSDKFPAMLMQTTPFTCLKPLRPGNDNTQLDNLIVMRSPADPIVKKVPLLQAATGIAAALEYEGDVTFPYTLGRLIELIRSPGRLLPLLSTPSTRYSRTSVTIHAAASTNTMCSIRLIRDNVTEVPIAPDNLPHGDSKHQQQRPDVDVGVAGEVYVVQGQFSPTKLYKMKLTMYGPTQQFGRDIESRLMKLEASSGASKEEQAKLVLLSNITRPAQLTLPQLAERLQTKKNINMTANIKMWEKPPHRPLSELADVTLSGGLSVPRLQLLLPSLPRTCPWDSRPLPGRAVYDTFDARVRLAEKVEQKGWLADVMRSLAMHAYANLYPTIQLEYDTSSQTKNVKSKTYTLSANRFLQDNKWSVKCDDCNPKLHGSGITTPRRLDQTFFALAMESCLPDSTYWSSRNEIKTSLSSSDESPSSILPEIEPFCWTDSSIVGTFDNLTYEKLNTSSCYQLLAADCSEKPKWYVFTQDFKTDERHSIARPLWRYLDAEFDLDVEGGYDLLRINGKKQPLTDGAFALIHPKTGVKVGECVNLPMPTCKFYDKVELKYFLKFESNEAMKRDGRGDQRLLSVRVLLTLLGGAQEPVCGLCGNRDGDPSNDNIGARRCQYSDMALMAASWTADSLCASDEALSEQLEEVHRVQGSSELCRPADHPWPWAGPDTLPPLPDTDDNQEESKLGSEPEPEPEPESEPEPVKDDSQCMFKAYEVFIHVSFKDQVYLALNQTHFCDKILMCIDDKTKLTEVTAAGWPVMSAPLAVMGGLDVGFVNRLPNDITPNVVQQFKRSDAVTCKRIFVRQP